MSEWPTVSRRAFVGLSGLSVAGGFSGHVAADTDDRVRWLDSDVNASGSSATVVNGTLFIGTRESGVAAYRINGDQQWAFEDTAEFFLSSPTVVDGVCYVKDNTGSLFALKADTGELLWLIKEQFTGRGSPTVYKDRCYVCGEEKLAAVDTFTGETEWSSSDILGPVGTGPTIFNGFCFVSGEGGMTAHDIQTGFREWAFDEAGYAKSGTLPFPSGVVVRENTAYVGSDQGTIFAISTKTGEKQWSWSAESAAFLTTPTIAENCLYGIGYVQGVGAHTPPATELISLDLTTDQPREKISTIIPATPLMGAPTIVSDSILWPTTSGVQIYSKEMDSATTVPYAKRTISDVIVVEGDAYVGSENGVLAIDSDIDETSSDLRVAQGSTGHHDMWAEEASLEIETLDSTLEKTTLEVGGDTSITATAAFANGRKESVLERATLESANPDVATVDDDGTIQAVSAGETEIVVTYRDETEHIGVVVEGDDSMPTPGLIGTAVGIGSGAYVLKRSRD